MANRMISYGYGMEGGELVVKEREAEIVRRVFREYIEGKLLQEIADELTEEGVEFYLGNCLWNKNKVFRIIENQKYIGAEGYPAIIGLEEFQKANQRKAARGNQKIALDAEIEYLKEITFCAQCGKPFHRRTKWKNREKWICPNGCKNDKYISDAEVFGGIQSAMRTAATEPDSLLAREDAKTYYPTQEIMRYTNEIGRMTNQPSPSFKAGKKLILECAALKFQACLEDKTAAYTEFVKEKVKREYVGGKVGIDFLTETVSQIKIYKDGSIGVVFLNGAEAIGKKEDRANAAKGRNKNRSESAVGKAK